MKNKYYYLILILLCILPATYSADKYYPAKNKLDNWIHQSNPLLSIPFRAPLYYSFFEFQSSIGIYGFKGWDLFGYDESAMGFDSTEIYLRGFRNSFIKRNYFEMDLNVIRVNWLAMVYPQNILDYMNGIGVRRITQTMPIGLNSEWENEDIGLAVYNYRPQIDEVYLSQALYYQPLEKLFLRFEHSYGFGMGTAYQTLGSDRLLDMTGTSQRYDFALQMVLDNKTQNTNLTASLHVFLHRGYYEINDKNNISPLEYIDMHSLGFGISLYAQLGARKTSGDKAIKLIKSRNYLAAKEEINSYIQKNPMSPRRGLALRYFNYCDSMAYMEYYQYGNKSLGQFNLAEALQFYEQAFGSRNKVIQQKVILRRTSIGRIFILNAMIELQDGDYKTAEAILLKAEELSPHFEKELTEAMAFVNIHKARVLIAGGLYERADSYLQLAAQQNKDLEKEMSLYRQYLAISHLEEAQDAVGNNDFNLANEAIKKAKILDRKLGDKLSNFDKDLQEKLKQLKQNKDQSALYSVYSKMKEEQFKGAEKLKTQMIAEVGMTLVEILDIFGPPFSKEKTKSKGVEYEMYVYKFSDKTLELYFRNYYLSHINELEP